MSNLEIKILKNSIYIIYIIYIIQCIIMYIQYIYMIGDKFLTFYFIL